MRNIAAAKRATCEGPVLITAHGKPSFVLMRIEEYHRITTQPQRTVLQVMDSIPGGGELAFDPAKLEIRLRFPDFELPPIESLLAYRLARLKL
jgi:hypothetical protein